MEIIETDSNSILKLELPGRNRQELQRIQGVLIALLDTKFFNMKSGRITLHIKDGFVMKTGVYTEEKARRLT